ncbi:hypothetical protein H477_5694 [[Clostridium] sordellii ATCC 9714]|nr:hypothetical protein H477_5694 [[Clostridium] sordellii ATCC 9714] [Paeniclostridium sordellii ATCC 9714]
MLDWGFISTALYRTLYNTQSTCLDRNHFIKEFKRKVLTHENFRVFLTREDLSDEETPSKIFTSVASAFKYSLKDSSWIDSISEVISELICNVASHTDSECILDINFDNKILDKGHNPYEFINICVINFSEDRIFDKVKYNIENKCYPEDDILYSDVYKAFKFHQKYFDSQYTEEDFYLITTFQNHVTSRNLHLGIMVLD